MLPARSLILDAVCVKVPLRSVMRDAAAFARVLRAENLVAIVNLRVAQTVNRSSSCGASDFAFAAYQATFADVPTAVTLGRAAEAEWVSLVRAFDHYDCAAVDGRKRGCRRRGKTDDCSAETCGVSIAKDVSRVNDISPKACPDQPFPIGTGCGWLKSVLGGRSFSRLVTAAPLACGTTASMYRQVCSVRSQNSCPFARFALDTTTHRSFHRAPR